MADDKQVNSAKPRRKMMPQDAIVTPIEGRLAVGLCDRYCKGGGNGKKKCMKALEELAKMEKNQAQEEKEEKRAESCSG